MPVVPRLIEFVSRRFPSSIVDLDGSAYANKSKIKVLLGDGVFDRFCDKTVIDFGCGYGDELLEIARSGAGRVIGLDIRDDVLARASQKIVGQTNAAVFNSKIFNQTEIADYVISLDAFEHFAHPEDILSQMHALLKPGGAVLGSFGPPWKHPLGGHSFALFPWAHLVFSEKSLCEVYNAKRGTSIKHFEECAGGLNRMTIRRFENVARSSPFVGISVTPVPIRKLRWAHNRLTREFTTAVIRCELVKAASTGRSARP